MTHVLLELICTNRLRNSVLHLFASLCISWKLAKAVSVTSLIDRSYLTVEAMNTRSDDRHVQLDSRFQHNTTSNCIYKVLRHSEPGAPSCCCRLFRRHEGSWQTPLVLSCFLKYTHNKYNDKWHNDAIKYDNECSYQEMYKSFLLPVMRCTLLKMVPWNMTAFANNLTINQGRRPDYCWQSLEILSSREFENEHFRNYRKIPPDPEGMGLKWLDLDEAFCGRRCKQWEPGSVVWKKGGVPDPFHFHVGRDHTAGPWLVSAL